MIEEIDDNSYECLKEYSFITELAYTLSKTYVNASERIFVSTAFIIGKHLTLGVVYFYHLVSLLFPITYKDCLTATLSSLAGCFFIEYPLASYKCTRNLLIFTKVYTTE